MKLVLNKCRGQFDLSELAIAHYAKRKGIALFLMRDYETLLGKKYRKNFYYTKPKEKRINKDDGVWDIQTIKRNDPVLIDIIVELGEKCNSSISRLTIEEIDDNIKWEIVEDDGMENVNYV